MTQTSRQLFDRTLSALLISHESNSGISTDELLPLIDAMQAIVPGVIMPAMPHGKCLWASRDYWKGTSLHVKIWERRPKNYAQAQGTFRWEEGNQLTSVHPMPYELFCALTGETVSHNKPTQFRLHAETKPAKKKR